MATKNEKQTPGTRIIPFEGETPNAILEQATQAAKTLQKIIAAQSKKLVLGGKQYLYFEDWQTLGYFYNTTAKVISTDEIREDGKLIGFLARAIAVRNGEEISAGEAECTFSENNWKEKPRFQLHSMAQTRACAKALRNCLAWIAVLAGYEPILVEEIEEAPAGGKPTPKPSDQPLATEAQIKRISTSARLMGYKDDEVREVMKATWEVELTKELTKEQASKFIQLIESGGTITRVDIEQASKDAKELWE